MHKLGALDRLAHAPLDDAARSLLAHIVGTYLRLDPAEEAELERLIADPALQEVREMVNIYEQRGIEKGIAKGIEQGIAEGLMLGQQRTLIGQLRRRFGDLPAEIVARVEAVRDPGKLDDLAARVLDAPSLEEMGLTG